MDAQFKKDWIAALRSKEFKQGTGTLYNLYDNSYCCIGVACIVAGRTKNEIIDRGLINAGLEEEASINETGIPSELIGDAEPGNLIDTLIKMNDGWEATGVKAHTFEEIADYIEVNL